MFNKLSVLFSRKASRRRPSKLARRKGLRFEPLEKRQLLAAGLVANLSVQTADGPFNMAQGVEGTSAIELQVSLSEPNDTAASITFDVEDLADGTAISGLDYVSVPTGAKISIPSGSSTGTFRIDVLDDFLVEPTELVHVRISNPSDPSITLGDAQTMAKIADNDNAGVTVSGADSLAISEAGATDTYTIALDSIPTGIVQITATADPQVQISTDGIHFFSALVLEFTDNLPQTITVRAVNDQSFEGNHSGTITHAITGTVVDPNYPDVTVESLYTQDGTDVPFQELIDSGVLPTGVNSTAGVTGSSIDVNNAILEQGPYGSRPFYQDFRLHTVANSGINRPDFDKWSRWYQEDGQTQIYRIFEGETNVRNDRPFAARIESWNRSWEKGVWNDFSARYTIIKPGNMALMQSFQPGVEWAVTLYMGRNGRMFLKHRINHDGGERNVFVSDDIVGKSFDVLVRDNGYDYEVYLNGELMATGYYTRPDSVFDFRWGMYRGGLPVQQDTLIFVSGAKLEADTSAPVGLVPYRPATTSLSIESATAEITDNDDAVQASVVGRGVAYADADASYGEHALDPTKSALRVPGTKATVANYTNYTRGLNRVVVDIDNLPASGLVANDFEFRVGNTADVSEWISLPPSSIAVTELTTTTKRVTLSWPNNAIQNRWLQVTVKANENTGLDREDVFFFGNQIGDVDGSTSSSDKVTVNAFDSLDVRFNQSPSLNSVGLSDPNSVYDIDRSGSINAFDSLDVRFNQMPSGGLLLITVPHETPLLQIQPVASINQNRSNPLDVNGDGVVSALDALIGINYLNQPPSDNGLRIDAAGESVAGHFHDVNGDGQVTALDSLIVINHLGPAAGAKPDARSYSMQSQMIDHDDPFDGIDNQDELAQSAVDLAFRHWDGHGDEDS